MDQDRHLSLDALRGFAVMGILAMNIVAFTLPRAAYINPMAWGITTQIDIASWAVAFLLVEGKMRGLFSLLFGASMLLVIERAHAAGLNARSIHNRRMLWLLVFGVLHYSFIWDGDILALYALCGLMAYRLVSLSASALTRLGVVFVLLNLLLWIGILASAHSLSALSSPDARASFADIMDALGAPNSPSIAKDLALYQSDYLAITSHRLSDALTNPLLMAFAYGFETLGLMAFGMALYKSGWLTGEVAWKRRVRAAFWAYGLGLPLLVGLAAWNWHQGFAPLLTADIYYAYSVPARLLVMMGHLLVLGLMISRFQSHNFMARVAAAGRMAFSNYILTSIVMTTLFYGYGGTLFGQMPRASIYLVVPLMWIIMLVWSPKWMAHFAYGPLEWLWRSLARGALQPLRLK